MEIKPDTLDGVEPRPMQPAVSSNSQKVSKFGSKAGFVIPKNKLSGSLVPIFRGTAKVAPADAVKEEIDQQVQRKTKWGSDPTQDAAVRKGRILAYQTRLEQITDLLKAGALGLGHDDDLESPFSALPHESKVLSNESEMIAQLELEKREVIGELLHLNPSYKVPPDYKPLLKEDKVSIPIKAYPGYNFIILLLGPESNALKRLEDETGVKVRVYGLKAGTREKIEITQSDSNEVQSNYDELYVHVSAETFEKVDAAIALIELLITPVIAHHKVSNTANFTTRDGGDVSDCNQKESALAHSSISTSTTSQLSVSPATMPIQPSSSMQYQPYPTPWYPVGPTNFSMPPSGYTPLSATNNALRFPIPPVNVSSTQPLGFRVPFIAGPRNQPGNAVTQVQPPMQPLQRPANPMPGYPNIMQPPANQPMLNQLVSFPPASHSMPIGVRSGRPVLPQTSVGPTTQAHPLTMPMHHGNAGWTNAPSSSISSRPSSMPMNPSQFPLPRPPQIAPQTPVGPQLQQNLPLHASIPVSQVMPSFSSQPSTSSSLPPFPTQSGPSSVTSLAYPPTSAQGPAPAPAPMPIFPGPVAHVSGGTVPNISTQMLMPTPSVPSAPLHPPIAAPSYVPGLGSNSTISSMPPPSVPGYISGSSSSVGSTSGAQVMTPKPPHPGFGDFTFQPLGSPVGTSMTTLRPPFEPSTKFPPHLQVNPQSLLPPSSSQGRLGAPQSPAVAPSQSPFRPALHNNPMIPMGAGALPWQSPMPPPSSMSTHNVRPPPLLTFPSSHDASVIAPSSHHQGSFPIPQAQNMGPSPSMPLLPIRHPNQMSHLSQHRPTTIQSQLLVGNDMGSSTGQLASSHGGSQTYDPFSPTSITPKAQGSGVARQKAGNTETDMEYEDLMASMGVK